MKSPACCCCPADPVSRSDMLPDRSRQGGVALITVLLIVFIASIAATSLAALQQRAIRRSTVLMHQQQARLYTLGAEQEAVIVLIRDRQNSETDHPGEEWANLPLALPVEGGTITARVSDLQGCFNLNNLWRPAPGGLAPAADPKQERSPSEDEKRPESAEEGAEAAPKPALTPPKPAQPDKSTAKAGLDQGQIKGLQRLLENLELKPELAQAIADWIDPDSDPLFPGGAEDGDYTVLNPPYLAANRPFISASELRLVKGMDREAYDKLALYICTLPPGTPLNVNTALAPVLAALGDGLTPADVERLLQSRPTAGYKNVDEFLNAAKLTVEAPVKAGLSTASQYFLLRAEARVGDGRAVLYSTLYRDENGVRILRRSFGNQD
ncbi:type II secretion system minor pseudopilin GspK [Candidatus Contendibacter odensensis]|nr:type II secretion system minor pseudopilin GspK [Candidatus Contendobacter odensis]MBK8754376.1 type II secretion system minor pseudopilin GspK [Candidatus Competibacteraceae bacterium]